MGELYLSLGYFYYKKFRLKDEFGPKQKTLILWQIVGCMLVLINFYMSMSMKIISIYSFYKYYFEYGFEIFAFSFGLTSLFLIITFVSNNKREKNMQQYNEINSRNNITFTK